MTTRPIVFYSIDPDQERLTYEDIHSAIYDTEPTIGDIVTVHCWARKKVPTVDECLGGDVLRSLLQHLDEDHELGDLDSATKPTPQMLVAERQFVESVLGLYVPWACEVVESFDVRIVPASDADDWDWERVNP
jgi:hypothetical protein